MVSISRISMSNVEVSSFITPVPPCSAASSLNVRKCNQPGEPTEKGHARMRPRMAHFVGGLSLAMISRQCHPDMDVSPDSFYFPLVTKTMSFFAVIRTGHVSCGPDPTLEDCKRLMIMSG